MAKKKQPVEPFNLICQDCGEHNYTVGLKKEHKSLQVKKYCPRTRTHTMHKAKKV